MVRLDHQLQGGRPPARSRRATGSCSPPHQTPLLGGEHLQQGKYQPAVVHERRGEHQAAHGRFHCGPAFLPRQLRGQVQGKAQRPDRDLDLGDQPQAQPGGGTPDLHPGGGHLFGERPHQAPGQRFHRAGLRRPVAVRHVLHVRVQCRHRPAGLFRSPGLRSGSRGGRIRSGDPLPPGRLRRLRADLQRGHQGGHPQQQVGAQRPSPATPSPLARIRPDSMRPWDSTRFSRGPTPRTSRSTRSLPATWITSRRAM